MTERDFDKTLSELGNRLTYLVTRFIMETAERASRQ
jgi:hypothetical protein